MHVLVATLALWLTGPAAAAAFPLPAPGDTIVGQLQVVAIANPRTTLLDIARHFDLGYEEIVRANPDVSIWVPKLGTKVVIPTEFILPPGKREGIVINIPQRRLFYFIKATRQTPGQVVTMPLGIARRGWETPLGTTRIIAKFRDPSWIVPKSIKQEHVQQGEADFPDYFPPGPDNPMGMLAMETGFPMIFIHGTNKPWGVGMRPSHGCLHLYPEDAAFLFPLIKTGTPVRIVNLPNTAGERDGVLYMSSAEPVDDYAEEVSAANQAVEALFPFTADARSPEVDWQRVFKASQARRYLPVPVSHGAPGIEQIVESIDIQPYDYEPYGVSANNAAPPAEALQREVEEETRD